MLDLPASFAPQMASPLKDAVYSKYGMVCTSQQVASQIGVDILKQGGSAADACVAMSAALCVIEPMSTGLGGDMFALYWDASDKKVRGLNSSGKSPSNLTLEMLRKELGSEAKQIPQSSPHAVTVPGAVSGWFELLSKHGKLNIEAVLGPARDIARNGFVVQNVCGGLWEMAEDFLKAQKATEHLINQTRAPKVGEEFKYPGMAKVFDLLIGKGSDGFYSGEVAKSIVSTLQDLGGKLDENDLINHKAEWVDPISVEFKDHTVWEIPPNGQGIVALIALNILKYTNIDKCEFRDANYYHYMIEALRIAFSEAKAGVVSCPEHNKVNYNYYLSKEYGERRAKEITNDSAGSALASPLQTCDTVYLCAVDSSGNACSFIQSVYKSFGSGIVAKGFDFCLQNRGQNFNLEPGHANCYAPSKKPYHTIIPGMLTKNGEIVGPFGVMGGFMQPQGHVQVLLSMLMHNLTPQEALNQPRFCIQPEGHICAEISMGEEILKALASKGHKLKVLNGAKRRCFGRGQAIIRKDNVWSGGTEIRSDGCALSLYKEPKVGTKRKISQI